MTTRTPSPTCSSTPRPTRGWSPTTSCRYHVPTHRMSTPPSARPRPRAEAASGSSRLPAGISSAPTPWPTWPAAPRAGRAAAATSWPPATRRRGTRRSSEQPGALPGRAAGCTSLRTVTGPGPPTPPALLPIRPEGVGLGRGEGRSGPGHHGTLVGSLFRPVFTSPHNPCPFTQMHRNS